VRTDGARILLLSALAADGSNLEEGNLGNYAIIEPLFRHLRERFPDSDIRTTLQLTDRFCTTHKLIRLQDRRFFTFGRATCRETIKDLLRLGIWKLTHRWMPRTAVKILQRSALLGELVLADLVVDWSGDVYGDNAAWPRFLEHSARLFMAIQLDKPVAVIAVSPGPFRQAWRRATARWLFDRVDLIANREPESTALVTRMGVKNLCNRTTGCPAFLFPACSTDRVTQILRTEDIAGRSERREPLIGLVISGWNLKGAKFNRVPREPWELEPFVQLVGCLVDQIGADVVVMSHQSGKRVDGALVPGTDHSIVEQLLELVRARYPNASVKTLAGVYQASDMKGLLGQFDLVLSGRIHGAIGAVSQCVPTVFLEYENGPVAHKVRGFARLVGLEDYVSRASDIRATTDVVTRCWQHRRELVAHLQQRIPEVQNATMENFSLLEDILSCRKTCR